MSRALLNNEGVIKVIKEKFIPVSGSVEHLQPSRYGGAESKSSKWFEPVAKRALREFGPPGFFEQFGSYQGMYVTGPDGIPYAFKVGLAYDPQDFIQVLQSALNKSKTSAKRARVSASTPVSDAPPGALPSTSVVQVYSRILPLPDNSTLSERSIGRDVMWIFPKEIDEIIAQSRAHPGAVTMPASLVARMVRFQLLNHVGNIMRPFSEKDVKRADFRITSTVTQGSITTCAFQGAYASTAPASKDAGAYSVEGTIEGRIAIDQKHRKVVQFRAFGEGSSQGGNDSLARTRKYPVVFAMTEATHPESRSVKPFWAAIPLWEQVYESPTIVESKSAAPR